MNVSGKDPMSRGGNRQVGQESMSGEETVIGPQNVRSAYNNLRKNLKTSGLDHRNVHNH